MDTMEYGLFINRLLKNMKIQLITKCYCKDEI